MFEMKLVSDALEKSGQKAPAVVLVSVDGERDTPEVMKQYLAAFPESFIGLTGDPKSVRKIAAEFKAVFFKGLPYDNAGNYQVEHTSLIYLVDPEGRLRASFLDAPVESMASSIRQLRSGAT
jgi:protein SCO1/2